jgi:uncharacterized membrane protein
MSDQGSNGNGGRKPKSPSNQDNTVAVAPRSEIVPPTLESVLRNVGVDPTDPNISKALEVSLTMMFSGSLPLAPPAILKEYGNIRPELIDKLVQWTEQQSAHRREMEKMRTEGSEKRMYRAQWIGAAVALGGLSLAAYVAHYSEAAAIAIALVAVGGPTAAIWLAHNMRRSSHSTLPTPPTPPLKPSGPQVS